MEAQCPARPELFAVLCARYAMSPVPTSFCPCVQQVEPLGEDAFDAALVPPLWEEVTATVRLVAASVENLVIRWDGDAVAGGCACGGGARGGARRSP